MDAKAKEFAAERAKMAESEILNMEVRARVCASFVRECVCFVVSIWWCVCVLCVTARTEWNGFFAICEA